MTEKDDYVYKAKLAEQAERYDGMMRSKILSSSNSERHVGLATRLCVIICVTRRDVPKV